jgi:cytosine/adenosine deaminase-related metal-dependent hydrolase
LRAHKIGTILEDAGVAIEKDCIVAVDLSDKLCNRYTAARARCNVATAPSTGENIQYGYAPIIELLEAGANVAITTDGSAPLFSFDLWKDIQRAMWHQWIIHKSRAQVLLVGKALRMVTIDAALALGIARARVQKEI